MLKYNLPGYSTELPGWVHMTDNKDRHQRYKNLCCTEHALDNCGNETIIKFKQIYTL